MAEDEDPNEIIYEYASWKRRVDNWDLIDRTENGAHFIAPKQLFYPGLILAVIVFFIFPAASVIIVILTIILYFISPQSSFHVSINDMKKELRAKGRRGNE